MADIFILQGITLKMYGLDAEPPHLHVFYGKDEFTITLDDRTVEGKGKVSVIKLVNEFIDNYQDEVRALWAKAQRGEPATLFELKAKAE